MDTGGVTPATAVIPAKPRAKSKRMDCTERGICREPALSDCR